MWPIIFNKSLSVITNVSMFVKAQEFLFVENNVARRGDTVERRNVDDPATPVLVTPKVHGLGTCGGDARGNVGCHIDE